jgi:uncharacterized membrane protein YtjA (UPF0391 family)
MLILALIFLLISIVSAIVGFTGMVVNAAFLLQILFYIFLGLSIITFAIGIISKPPKV